LNTERHSYRTNKYRELQYVTTIYKSENLQLDVEFENTLFAEAE